MSEKNCKLQYGVRSHSMTSRDNGEPVFVENKQEALKELIRLKIWFASLGYWIWYANFYDEKGEITNLMTV